VFGDRGRKSEVTGGGLQYDRAAKAREYAVFCAELRCDVMVKVPMGGGEGVATGRVTLDDVLAPE
jgi:hypothetical protein